MDYKPASLPRGLNFDDNRRLADEHSDGVGYCAQCGDEDKARVLAYNRIHSGHAVCYRCLRSIRNQDSDTTKDDLAKAERTGAMPWEKNEPTITENDLPF